MWSKDHNGLLRRVRHWKDVRDMELAALENGTVWSHRVIALETGASRDDAVARWHDSRVASYLDDRAARGKKPAVPQGIDAEFLERVDIIGDLHGCVMTLRELADSLGYDTRWEHPEGRRLVLLGDFADKNLVRGNNLQTVRQVCALLVTGRAVAVMGNHDRKLLRAIKAVMEADKAFSKRVREPTFRELPKLSEHVLAALRGAKGDEPQLRVALRSAAGWMRQSSPRYGIDLTLHELSEAEDALDVCKTVVSVYGALSHQMVLANGTVIAVHAGTRADLVGASTRKARDMALFGDVSGKLDANGYPERRDWTKAWDDERVVVYGHEIQEGGARVSGAMESAIGIDTGAYEHGEVEGFRGLTALRWPEREFVSVETVVQDVLQGEERERAQRWAVAAGTTARKIAEVDAPGLARPPVRVLADALVATQTSAWVTGMDAVAASRGGTINEVQVCADGDGIAAVLEALGAVRHSERFTLEVAGEELTVKAIGSGVTIDAWMATQPIQMGTAMVSLWGDGELTLDEVRVEGHVRAVLRDDPDTVLEAVAASVAARVPLERHLAFALRTAKQAGFSQDAREAVLWRMNAMGGGDLGRFLAACGSMGLLVDVLGREIPISDVKMLSGEADGEKRWETLQGWLQA